MHSNLARRFSARQMLERRREGQGALSVVGAVRVISA
jgi:hypothetical protein